MPSEVSFAEGRPPLHVLSFAAMLNLGDVPESCTAEEAVAVVSSLARRLAISGEVPSLRTLRLWRSRQLLSRSGRRLTRRNLLEVLGIMRLRGEGVTTGAAAQRCAAIDEERLLSLVTVVAAAPLTTPADFAEVTLILLARSVLEQFHLVTGILSRVVDWPVAVAWRPPVVALDLGSFAEGRVSAKWRDQAVVTAAAPAAR